MMTLRTSFLESRCYSLVRVLQALAITYKLLNIGVNSEYWQCRVCHAGNVQDLFVLSVLSSDAANILSDNPKECQDSRTAFTEL
jgi:hypothetical protein